MSCIVNVIFALVVTCAVTSASVIGQREEDSFNLEGLKDVNPMSGLLYRNKREDVIKFLVDAVDDDIDKCGSPLQIQNDQVTVSVGSLTCIVQALVDSLNQGPGLLRRLLDNILKKRDLSAVELKAPFTRAEQECAMKAIIKEAIDVVKEQHGAERRHKRRTHDGGSGGNRCAQIENEIEKAMKKQMEKKDEE